MGRRVSRAHAVAACLSSKYADFGHYNKRNPLRELLFIICSLQTDEAKYRRTYKLLCQAFPRFEDLAAAREAQIVKVIASGGLARQKARAIEQMMRSIEGRCGRPSLTHLQYLGNGECEQFLRSLPGVGLKSARCVMLYSLDRLVFPVDTHCWRVSRRIGWVRATRADGSCSPKDMERLQAKIPEALRFSLHVNMISLGREFCVPRNPRCEQCPISAHCRKRDVQ